MFYGFSLAQLLYREISLPWGHNRDAWRGPHRFPKWLHQRELLQVTETLEILVHKNVPMVEGLRVMSLDAPSRALRHILLFLAERLEEGYALADAMRRLDRFFPGYYCDLVEAGEETGQLVDVFRNLYSQLVEEKALRSQARLCVQYLVFVALVTGSILLFLSVRIFPIYQEILSDFDMPLKEAFPDGLPNLRVLENPAYVWNLVFGAALLFIAFRLLIRFWIRDSSFWGMVALSLPGVRHLFAKRQLAPLAGIVSRFARARVPVHEAFEEASRCDIHPLYQALAARVCARTQAGQSLSEATGNEFGPLLPKSFREALSVGEESGLLGEILGRLAVSYARDIQTFRNIAVKFIVPIGVVMIGMIVMNFAVLAMTMQVLIGEAILGAM